MDPFGHEGRSLEEMCSLRAGNNRSTVGHSPPGAMPCALHPFLIEPSQPPVKLMVVFPLPRRDVCIHLLLLHWVCIEHLPPAQHCSRWWTVTREESTFCGARVSGVSDGQANY